MKKGNLKKKLVSLLLMFVVETFINSPLVLIQNADTINNYSIHNTYNYYL